MIQMQILATSHSENPHFQIVDTIKLTAFRGFQSTGGKHSNNMNFKNIDELY